MPISSNKINDLASPSSLERVAKPVRWGQDRRLEFIDFRLLWEGQINRGDLMRFFSVSKPQASLDLARYMELAPRNIQYDRSNKIYRAGRYFRPAFTEANASRYLNELLAVNSGMMARESTFIGWFPPADAVLSPRRRVSAGLLFHILSAIRNRTSLSILYQSMTRTEPIARRISPHAIGYDGSRWHVRAYSHERDKFRDFVFARILRMEGEEPSSIDPGDDAEWNTMHTVELIPHPGLSASQKRAIELDFDMENGKATFSCREALLFYFLQRLGLLNRSADATPQSLQVELVNRSEIEEIISRGNSTRAG